MNTPQAEGPTFEKETPQRQSFLRRAGSEIFKVILLIVFVILPIRAFVAQPFIVSGSSMVPTFNNGDYLIVNQLSLRLHNPSRNDVVIFKYPQNPEKYFIKRIIGLPGERVTISSGSVMVYNEEHPEGLSVPEPTEQSITVGDLDITLSESEYFVMGDNRESSSDSRVWGPLERKFIVGTPLIRLLPISEVEFSPGVLSDPTNRDSDEEQQE